jgi:hypothetical protein
MSEVLIDVRRDHAIDELYWLVAGMAGEVGNKGERLAAVIADPTILECLRALEQDLLALDRELRAHR